MPDFEKIMHNFRTSGIIANLFVLFKVEITYIEGWISLAKILLKFISPLQGEIEYCLGEEYYNMDDNLILYID
ncbi:MAG: hypothetical protein ACFFG0_15725, partial [Candidatus Thorarchaeota archaeon]